MTNKHDTIWIWIRTKNRKYRVVSNKQHGCIKVYDNHGHLILEKTNLTKKQIEQFETTFLTTIAKKLSSDEPPQDHTFFDPMIA
jgi:hypothetical protein